MIYSVFDWGNGKYRLYQDSRQYAIMSDPKSCAPQYSHRIGVDVNAALCTVPADAQFAGWSDYARGQVSRLSSGPAFNTPVRPNYGGPDLGSTTLGYYGPALGQDMRALTFSEAIFASTVISIVSGLASAWFFKHVQVPVR